VSVFPAVESDWHHEKKVTKYSRRVDEKKSRGIDERHFIVGQEQHYAKRFAGFAPSSF
jgi:hypothetical protein